jgi:AraC-like DNA-binding protein
MSPATARLPLALKAPIVAPRAQVPRLFSRGLADTVRVEDCGADGLSRMHPWFGISLVRSPALVSVESRRDVVADRNWMVLVPPFELHELRPQGEAAQRAVTLLLGGSHIEGFDIAALPALVTDPVLGERVAALVAHVQQGGRSDEQATTIRSMLEQLLLCSIPIAAGRVPRFSRLTRVRTFLQTHVSEPVSIEHLARMSALSECHLISAFRFEFGLPPHAYHLRLRLAAACEALARGMAVASVAYEYGFADQSHLSRKFKSVYGVSPAAWANASARTFSRARP